ncbi:MAG: response regulator [Sulfurimonas sp.]
MRKFLVTDDSKLARRTLIKSLKEYILEERIFEASNGFEALKLTLKEKPDVVFLDLTMPVMDGYEAIPKIKNINPDIKIVVVSADIQEKAKEKVYALGATLHVQKPIKSDKMKAILEVI